MPMIYGCACRLGNHPHNRRSPVHPTISAKDGEPDAEKPDPRGGSPFSDYGKKEIDIHLDPAIQLLTKPS